MVFTAFGRPFSLHLWIQRFRLWPMNQSLLAYFMPVRADCVMMLWNHHLLPWWKEDLMGYLIDLTDFTQSRSSRYQNRCRASWLRCLAINCTAEVLRLINSRNHAIISFCLRQKSKHPKKTCSNYWFCWKRYYAIAVMVIIQVKHTDSVAKCRLETTLQDMTANFIITLEYDARSTYCKLAAR